MKFVAVISMALMTGGSPTEAKCDFERELGRSPRSFYEQTVDLSADSTDRIQHHLQSMVRYLEAQPTPHLSDAQRLERGANIERLRRYARDRVFPQNHVRRGMTPIFIDAGGRACAVGYLMMESDAKALAEQIAREENYRYLSEIRTPGVKSWIGQSGLSARECAMIQPAYMASFIQEFTATSVGDDVHITWTFADGVDVNILWITRDGVIIASAWDDVPEDLWDLDLPPGVYQYELYAEEGFVVYDTATFTLDHGAGWFKRGDANGDGVVEGVGDPIYILNYAFVGGPPPPCLESADTDGNGSFEPLSDALYVMYYTFLGGPIPTSPFPDCGPDPLMGTSLGCVDSSVCP